MVERLVSIYQIPKERAAKWLPYIIEAMQLAELNTTKRLACFLAQIGHESGRLRYVKEIWGPTKQQLRYEGTDLAKRLGNIKEGDGKRYLGRGLLQVTGRYNYVLLYKDMKEYYPDCPDFEKYPELVETPEWAAKSAALYWKRHNLNKFADSGDFIGLTKAINGGLNGLDDRQELFIRCLAVLEN
jgi:putative chitinase